MTDDIDLRLLDQNVRTAQMLGHAVALRDHDTGAHNMRVAFYAGLLGEALEFDRLTIQGLMKGAFLHDVGKIAIPDSILLKPGRLTDEEFAEMRRHPGLGAQLLEDLSWFEDAVPVVRHHHERFNGTGYPDGLGGSNIPVVARAFAIIDVFDALVSDRPYKQAFPLDKAVALLGAGAGTQFDTGLVSVFVRIAPPLHEKVSGQAPMEVQPHLEDLRRRHFGA